jgi:hypothetical protein
MSLGEFLVSVKPHGEDKNVIACWSKLATDEWGGLLPVITTYAELKVYVCKCHSGLDCRSLSRIWRRYREACEVKASRLPVPLFGPTSGQPAYTPTLFVGYIIARKNWVDGPHGYVRRAVEGDVEFGMLRADASPEEVALAVIRRFTSRIDLDLLPHGYCARSLEGVVRSIVANWRSAQPWGSPDVRRTLT